MYNSYTIPTLPTLLFRPSHFQINLVIELKLGVIRLKAPKNVYLLLNTYNYKNLGPGKRSVLHFT